MSSPMRKTVSSRSISSCNASRSATRMTFSATRFSTGFAALPPFARVKEFVQLVDRWVGALIREFDGLFDLLVDLAVDPLQVFVTGDPSVSQLVLEMKHGVAFQRLLLLFVGPVLVRVDHRMSLEAIADRFDE